jgi:hypothetical protein
MEAGDRAHEPAWAQFLAHIELLGLPMPRMHSTSVFCWPEHRLLIELAPLKPGGMAPAAEDWTVLNVSHDLARSGEAARLAAIACQVRASET